VGRFWNIYNQLPHLDTPRTYEDQLKEIDMPSIFQKIRELEQTHTPAALVTIIKTQGSVPRNIGTKMIVQLDGEIHGTIGGSTVEALVIEEAQNAIHTGQPRVVTHTLSDELNQDTGMICGGTLDLFIEPILLPEKVYIFGGGHVGFHVASFVKRIGFEFIIIDERPEFASIDRFPDALMRIVDNPESVANNLEITNTDYIVIVTHGHQYDYEVLRSVITKPARYIGMIASTTKRNQIYHRLRTVDNISDDLLSRIHSPIGVDIGAETPEEIAISIVAELIQIRRSRS
jgi:xanthine dehydrogenase accessory factor